MTLIDLYNKIKNVLFSNENIDVLISTKNNTILNIENDFKDANRILNIEVSDIKIENNKCIISHKENVVSLSRDNEYIFLKWRNDEYAKIRKKLINLLKTDFFSEKLKLILEDMLVEEEFHYEKYVNLDIIK